MEDIFTIPFVTFVLSVALATFGYVGTSNSESHIVQQSANAAARIASQDPNPADAVNAAVQALQAGGLPTTWNGQPVIDPNKVQIGSADNGHLITTTISVNAPVAFPGLLRFLGVSSGPTQTVTRTGEYANEWGTTNTDQVDPIPVSGGSGGTGGVTTPPYSVSLSVNPASSIFLNGTTVTLTATANQDVSLSGDALQILDETTGQWIGMPIYQGTADTVTVSGTNESDTYVGYVAPLGDSAGAIAQSSSETLQWESITNFASSLTITAKSPSGTVWDYHSNEANGGKPNVFAGTPVILTANLPGIYMPSGSTFEIEDMSTGQVIDSGTNTSALTTTVTKANSTDMYAAICSFSGQQASTDSVGHDVEVKWLNSWSVSLTDSLNGSNQTASFTGTVNYPLQSSTMDGTYQDWMYLYNQSLGQWEAPRAITGNITQYTWSGITGVNGDSFVVYVEPSSSVVAGSYGSTGQVPPIESSSVTVPKPVISLNGMGSVYPNSSESVSGTLTWGGQPLAGQVVALSASGGSVTPATVTTNSSGTFSATWTAPSYPGTVSITASALGTSATTYASVFNPPQTTISPASISTVSYGDTLTVTSNSGSTVPAGQAVSFTITQQIQQYGSYGAFWLMTQNGTWLIGTGYSNSLTVNPDGSVYMDGYYLGIGNSKSATVTIQYQNGAVWTTLQPITITWG